MDGLRGRSLAALGFLVMSYVLVGLIAAFATFATPLPLERALAREAVLDEVLARADDAAALAGLKRRLGDSAPVLEGDRAGLAARVAAERVAMRARFRAEAEGIAFRLRIAIAIFTISAAAFGVAVAGLVSRRRE
jgi:hypothetical protein